jgi:hypothetical protein
MPEDEHLPARRTTDRRVRVLIIGVELLPAGTEQSRRHGLISQKGSVTIRLTYDTEPHDDTVSPRFGKRSRHFFQYGTGK